MQQNDDIDRQVRVIQKLHDFFQIYSLESEKKRTILKCFHSKNRILPFQEGFFLLFLLPHSTTNHDRGFYNVFCSYPEKKKTLAAQNQFAFPPCYVLLNVS